MVDVCELTKFTASGKVLRLVMDIAAALERYKIAMIGKSRATVARGVGVLVKEGWIQYRGSKKTGGYFLKG